MADNDEILKQIALLSGALNRQPRLSSSAQYHGRTFHPYQKRPFQRSHNLTLVNKATNAPLPSTSVTNSKHVPASKAYKPSRHRTLVNIPRSSSLPLDMPSGQPQNEANDPSTAFVKTGNKLVRVGSAPLSKPRPPKPPTPIRSKKLSKKTYSRSANKTLIIVDGMQYSKSADGSKLVAANAKRDLATPRRKTVNINGVAFIRDASGRKLIRKTEITPQKKTPKRVVLNGLSFVRSKTGNLVLSNKTPPSLKEGTKAMHNRNKILRKPKYCQFYRFGRCDKGLYCRFAHVPERLAVCPAFLKGQCDVESCKLSHSPNMHNMPTCLHFERGRCRNENCPYLHVKLSPDAAICRDFALEGFCEAGDQCKNRHVYQCPDFAEGKCKNKKCHLPHKAKPKDDRERRADAKDGNWSRMQQHAEEEKEDEELMQLPIRPDFSVDVMEELTDEEEDTSDESDMEDDVQSHSTANSDEVESGECSEKEDDEEEEEEDSEGDTEEENQVIEIYSESEEESMDEDSAHSSAITGSNISPMDFIDLTDD
ncbi:uncharacterized protein SPPG_03144 [Spizellomyces punctatus DAOM BR117]|uniref:C3H1-type domain-containing protein n=1 Tax=Spizellomyces punctatus (strain DAOM BR117) TaxID=645134 RepID=A0A0L0HJN2_SPIPD|nr:uncharacterized protein SPPG_03144 [Spizellomyces punctatus DAOM BR117]KND01332.1 hypothetical protein SPPG_03144 [Spizellomyces punctatus DAOM BR117]|eukprot:XP_016609371.1 hypothetical protein SPPG_03144 [Spizellomyces punctatus DAOM BR117]